MFNQTNNIQNSKVPVIIASRFELGSKYREIGFGNEGTIYNYNDKYALKRFSLFRALEYFYDFELKRRFMKIEAMTSLKDESFCYPIGILQSDEITKEGCYTDLVHYEPSIKDFNYLNELKDTKKILEYILKADAAIQRAHNNDVVIGDIKESNIMIDINGDIKFVDTDSYAYQDFYFELTPERAKCLEKIYGHPVSMIDNDIFVFSVMALRLLTQDDAFKCFDVTEEYYRYLIERLNDSKEVKDGLKIIFSDAPNKPYIGPILQKIDLNQKL